MRHDLKIKLDNLTFAIFSNLICKYKSDYFSKPYYINKGAY